MTTASQTSIRWIDPRISVPLAEIQVNLRELVGHQTAVQAGDPLSLVQHRFSETEVGYMAVLEGQKVVGLCARHEIAMQLGSQYGFSLFARSPVREHLLSEPIRIADQQNWKAVLNQVFPRAGERFNEDVLLVDADGDFLGLITVQTLIRLQTRLLLEAIDQLNHQRVEIDHRNRQMIAELTMAREVQRAMLPMDFQPICTRVNCAGRSIHMLAHFEPKSLVSGDFYEILAVSDAIVSIFIADVMGHGVRAALVTAMLRALIQENSELAADPAALMTAVNQSLCLILADAQDPVFVSAFAAALDVSSGSLHYANAGHPSPILLRRGEETHSLQLECSASSNGGVLGIRADSLYRNDKAWMESGDRLLLFTDGLFEVAGDNKEILGLEGLFRIAREAPQESAEELVASVLGRAREFSVDQEFDDDVCVLVVELTGAAF